MSISVFILSITMIICENIVKYYVNLCVYWQVPLVLLSNFISSCVYIVKLFSLAQTHFAQFYHTRKSCTRIVLVSSSISCCVYRLIQKVALCFAVDVATLFIMLRILVLWIVVCHAVDIGTMGSCLSYCGYW